MPSPASPVRNRPLAPHREMREDRGSAAVEFSMIAVLLAAIFFVVLQVGIYLYQRSIIASSTLAAARYAANANIPTAQGSARAHQLLSDALSESAAAGISCTATDQLGEGDLQLVVVRCVGSVPSLAAVLGPVLPIDSEASAIEESQ